MAVIRRVSSGDSALRAGLCALLEDCVRSGSSVGFVAPLTRATTERYWQRVLDSLGEELVLWVAEDGGEVLATVQLAPCLKDNGRHRAEVQKLLVKKARRGERIASRLLEALEEFACANGRTLLVLDTETKSPAESIYRHLGWQRVGDIPGYATTPTGELVSTTYFFKTLSPSNSRISADSRA